jgi:DnaK suppressor protein
MPLAGSRWQPGSAIRFSWRRRKYRRRVADDGTRAALERLRSALASEVKKLAADLHAVFEASQDSNADDEHDPEGNTIAYERAQLAAVLAATRHRLADVEKALTRLDTGGYGICEHCGHPIPAARLAIRPFARTCVTCN